MDEWAVSRWRGTAATLHQLRPPDPPEPSVWIHEVARPALVLGSAQPDVLVDQARAAADGIEVCRRRSGGGLVHLSPLDCWIDVIIPATSPLWERDVGRAFHWIGQVWADALGDILGPAGPAIEVHRGPLSGREAGRLVCFAGLGPGEVTVGDRKVVGLSQRRWRTGLKFQCLVLPRWQPETIGRYLDPLVLAAAGLALDSLPIGLASLSGREPVADRGEMERAFIARLPSPASSACRRAGIEPTTR